MAKTKQQKEESVVQLAEDFDKAKSVIFVNFSGLKVTDIEDLRKRCREQNVGCKVIKKTLLAKGLEKTTFKGDLDVKEFDNGIAALLGYEDEVSPAKIAKDFAKEHDSLDFYGGIITSKDLENNFLTKDGALELSKLPSKLELYAKLVGSINAPVSGFVNVLSGNLRGLVTVLKAIEEQKS